MSTRDNGAIETPDWSPEPHEWDETAYLMASPANAEALRRAVARARRFFHNPTCPYGRCFVCDPHEGFGTYPEPLDGRGDN